VVPRIARQAVEAENPSGAFLGYRLLDDPVGSALKALPGKEHIARRQPAAGTTSIG
jgi:hypothetical protein